MSASAHGKRRAAASHSRKGGGGGGVSPRRTRARAADVAAFIYLPHGHWGAPVVSSFFLKKKNPAGAGCVFF